MKMNRIAKLAVAGIAASFLVSGCGSDTKKDAPEPSPDNIIDGTNTQVIKMPDGFRNIAFTCYGPNGIYATSRGANQNGNKDFIPLASTVAVVVNDSHCVH